jgi:hypothetical protein
VPWVHTCHPKPHLTVTLESPSPLTLACPMPSSVSSRESYSMTMFPCHFSQCSYSPTRPICRTLRALDRWPRSRTHPLPQQRPKTKCSPQRSTWHYHANCPHVSCATNLAEPKCVTSYKCVLIRSRWLIKRMVGLGSGVQGSHLARFTHAQAPTHLTSLRYLKRASLQGHTHAIRPIVLVWTLEH